MKIGGPGKGVFRSNDHQNKPSIIKPSSSKPSSDKPSIPDVMFIRDKVIYSCKMKY